MKVAYIVRPGWCTHDYGADWFFEGLVDVLGFDNVLDYPEGDSLHLPEPGKRDECNIDSDQSWPKRDHHLAQMGDVDLIIVTTDDWLSGQFIDAIPGDHMIAALDFGDIMGNRRGVFDMACRRKVNWYFKRELPLGEDWAIPLPLTYSSRVRLSESKALRVFYHATHHAENDPGIPRKLIVNMLRDQIDAKYLDVKLYPGQAQGTRPSPEEYHAEMEKALIGISWNGADNWDCNRFWENFAFGLAQVAERPRIEIPNAPIDGEHVLYVDEPQEVAEQVRWLVEHEEQARRIAAAGWEHFQRFHSAKCRATYVLDRIRADRERGDAMSAR